MENNSDFKILIIDDVKVNIDLAAVFLEEENYQIFSANSGKKALEKVFSQGFDLILLDINMPEMDGYEVCQRLKNDKKTKSIPVIFLSALDDIEAISKAFKLGAVDYIPKPFNGIELVARVKNQINIIKYINDIEEKQHRLAVLASTDSLTGLSNQRHFLSIIKKELASSTDNLCIAYISIDNMNKINNMYGYRVREKIIAKLAKNLETSLRDRDYIARLYGSEFIVLMPKTPFELARDLVKKLHTNVNKMELTSLNITCSFGMCKFDNDKNHETFIVRAEKLMEDAKKSGGNKIMT